MDRWLDQWNAATLARHSCFVGRTAADDLRALGYPVGDAGGGGTAVQDHEEADGEAQDGVEGESQDNDELIEERDEVPDPSDSLDEDDGSDQAGREAGATASYGETDETDPTFKKRFVASQKEHLKNTQRIEELEGQIAQIQGYVRPEESRREATTASAGDETAARLQAELDAIDPKDQDARRKTIQKWVGAMQETGAKAGEQAARRVINSEKDILEATRLGKEALKRKGLDPEKYFPMMDAKVAHLKATNISWFTRVPVGRQFDALADLVVADRNAILSEKAKVANQNLRKTASGVVDSRAVRGNKSSQQGKDDVPDRSFTKQLGDARSLRLADGAKRAGIAAGRS